MHHPSNIIRLSSDFSASQDISELSLKLFKAKGYRSLINLRTEDETDRQLSSTQAESICHSLNLCYRHFPIHGFEVTDLGVTAKFSDLIITLPKPIVAYCRAGTRAVYLWASVQAITGDLSLRSVEKIIDSAGFDYSAVSDELETLRLWTNKTEVPNSKLNDQLAIESLLA